MCEKCEQIKDWAISHSGYIYFCNCGHVGEWSDKDVPNWHTINYTSKFRKCHGCKQHPKYILQQHYTQIESKFVLGGAL